MATLTLRDQGGQPAPNGAVSVNLPANGGLAEFSAETFNGKGIDFSHFSGTLEVQASKAIAGMAIWTNPGHFATMPVSRVN